MKITRFFALIAVFGSFVSLTAAQDVTFNVTGTYPANMPVTELTAPSRGFQIEFTVPAVVPATPPHSPLFFKTSIVSGVYSFEGQTFASTPSSCFYSSNTAGNVETIFLSTSVGTIVLRSIPTYHTPALSTRQNNTAEFLVGDLGTGKHWSAYYLPVVGTSGTVPNTVDVSNVGSRLASAHAKALPESASGR